MKNSTLLGIAFVLFVVMIASFSIGIPLALQSYQSYEKEMVKSSPEVSSFDKVVMEGLGELSITQGEKESLTIEADKKMVELVVVEVRDNTLYISQKEKRPSFVSFSGFNNMHVTYTLVVKDLARLETKGLGDSSLKNLTTSDLDVITKGAGNVDVENLTAKKVLFKLEGLGEVKASGTVDELTVSIEGAGEFKGKKLQSRIAQIDIKGLGDGSIYATEKLKIDVKGLGDVTYYGNPELTSQRDGMGDINKGDLD